MYPQKTKAVRQFKVQEMYHKFNSRKQVVQLLIALTCDSHM